MAYQKQCVGIDIAKSSFTACVCKKTSGELSFSSVTTFSNERTGYNQFLRWVKSELAKGVELAFLMEATGVYYESLAHHLFKLKKTVHVVLPNTSKHYFGSLNIKTKTDKVDAKVLSQFGTEREHKCWTPPSKVFLELRNLTRYYLQLNEQKTALNNIKHAKDSAYHTQSFVLKSNQKLITQLDKQISNCKQEIERLVNSDPELQQRIQKVLSIKGVGLITVATILAETFGFEHFTSIKQLVSYAGYDVVQRESGTSIKGKTRISKKGNRYIRNALYFPAMVACRFNPNLKQAYIRINQNKPSKMIGQVAIQRKLLSLIFTLWKNNTEFIENYKKVVPTNAETTLDSSKVELP